MEEKLRTFHVASRSGDNVDRCRVYKTLVCKNISSRCEVGRALMQVKNTFVQQHVLKFISKCLIEVAQTISASIEISITVTSVETLHLTPHYFIINFYFLTRLSNMYICFHTSRKTYFGPSGPLTLGLMLANRWRNSSLCIYYDTFVLHQCRQVVYDYWIWTGTF